MTSQRFFTSLVLLMVLIFLGCLSSKETPQVTSLADAYFERTLQSHPEYAYFVETPNTSHALFSSNKIADLKMWEDFEDSLFTELQNIDLAIVSSRKDTIAYWYLLEDLASNIEMRVAQRHLWNVDPENSWQGIWLALAQIQPVENMDLQNQAIDRWKLMPDYVETEISNLRLGLSRGYSMPKTIVQKVINQFDALLAYDIEDSPFMLPGIRANNQKFYEEWKSLYMSKLLPALKHYHRFLTIEYFPAAREDVSVLALPNGQEIYQAYIRKHTSTNKTGREIFELGEFIVARNIVEIEVLGSQLYGENDFKKIMRHINNNPDNFFESEEQILETSQRLMTKAKKLCPHWFATLPANDATIKPYSSHESGSGAYEQASGDKPAFFRINLKNPRRQQKGRNEVLTFHESYPGHHIQIALEKEINDLHPIMNLISFTSYVEGWARYCEQLAEEMDLYESEAALITRRAWPSRGMVVDPGIHLLEWSKEQAVDYMTESGMNREMALDLYYRSLTTPAQLTSYDVGGEEFKSLRSFAESKLGDRFDVREFHSTVLNTGAIPLGPLRTVVEQWVATAGE